MLTSAGVAEFGFVTRSTKELDDTQAGDFVGFELTGESEIEVFEGFAYIVQHFSRS